MQLYYTFCECDRKDYWQGKGVFAPHLGRSLK